MNTAAYEYVLGTILLLCSHTVYMYTAGSELTMMVHHVTILTQKEIPFAIGALDKEVSGYASNTGYTTVPIL